MYRNKDKNIKKNKRNAIFLFFGLVAFVFYSKFFRQQENTQNRLPSSALTKSPEPVANTEVTTKFKAQLEKKGTRPHSVAAKAPIMPSTNAPLKIPQIPLGQKIPMPKNRDALTLKEVKAIIANTHVAEINKNAPSFKEPLKPKAPIMPKLELNLPAKLAAPPPIPMPRICADGKPCEKLI